MQIHLKLLASLCLSIPVLSACTSVEEQEKQLAKKNNMEKVFSYDGLLKKKSGEHKMVYVHPQLDLSDYDNIYLMDAHVAFRKNWQRNYNRDSDNKKAGLRVSDKDALKIKQRSSKLFYDVFSDVLSTNGYPIVETPNQNTLILKPSILNLELSAPHTSSPGRVEVYAKDTGTVTLFIEFFDGGSGQVIARFGEGKIIGEREFFRWANRAQNTADGKRLLKTWATRLKHVLDEAHQNEKLKGNKAK